MNRYISLVRGINVGGQKKIPMEGLKACYEALGLEKVHTYIQSGNVVFDYAGQSGTKLAQKIQEGIRRKFSFEVHVIIRDRDELLMVIENDPFTPAQNDKTHVTFLSAKPASIPTKEIAQAKSDSEEFYLSGREVYLFCPNGYGKSKLSNSLFERKLKVLATTRNWRTVKALNAIANA